MAELVNSDAIKVPLRPPRCPGPRVPTVVAFDVDVRLPFNDVRVRAAWNLNVSASKGRRRTARI